MIKLPDDATRPVAPVLENVTHAQKLPGRQLRMIHNHQRENMKHLRGLVTVARSGGLPDGGAEAAMAPNEMLQNLREFGSLCGQHCQIVHMHHSIEDAHIFPALADKAVGFRAVVQRLVDEHKSVHALLLQLVDELNALNAEQSETRLEAAMRTYEQLETFLLSHLGYEEDSISDALGVFKIGI
ncbi:MAG: hemerythrin domain-containing protein [Rhodobacteraceae bacterium]|nr:hemerythrin domain-containing protein [Paracoccaceae bacterium]